MFWRYYIADDASVDRYLVRDADSRLSVREARAVEEWILSGVRTHASSQQLSDDVTARASRQEVPHPARSPVALVVADVGRHVWRRARRGVANGSSRAWLAQTQIRSGARLVVDILVLSKTPLCSGLGVPTRCDFPDRVAEPDGARLVLVLRVPCERRSAPLLPRVLRRLAPAADAALLH